MVGAEIEEQREKGRRKGENPRSFIRAKRFFHISVPIRRHPGSASIVVVVVVAEDRL